MPNQYFQMLDDSLTEDLKATVDVYTGEDLLSGIVDQGTNFEFPDLYTITVNAKNDSQNTIDVALAAQTLNNPFASTNITDMTADNVTYNYDLIPGFGLKFYEASTLSVGDQVDVHIGYDLTDGTITAGNTSDRDGTQKKLAVKNLYTGAMSNCKVRVLAKPRPSLVSGQAVLAAYCDSLWAETESVELEVRHSGFVPGSNQVCQIDGGGDISIVCDATNYTEIQTGLYVKFNSAANMLSTDITTIRIADGYRFVELAPDDNGTPGTWVSGSPIDVTESGQITTGVIDAGEAAYFWKRVNVGSDISPTGNPREYMLVASGDITS